MGGPWVQSGQLGEKLPPQDHSVRSKSLYRLNPRSKIGKSIFSARTERLSLKRIFHVARCVSANQDSFMVHAFCAPPHFLLAVQKLLSCVFPEQ